MAELVREIVIDASPETIWPFLTEPTRHVEWLGTDVEIDPRPGGVYRVLVGGQHQSAGEYLEVVPHEKVVFTFGWEEKDQSHKFRLTKVAPGEMAFGPLSFERTAPDTFVFRITMRQKEGPPRVETVTFRKKSL